MTALAVVGAVVAVGMAGRLVSRWPVLALLTRHGGVGRGAAGKPWRPQVVSWLPLAHRGQWEAGGSTEELASLAASLASGRSLRQAFEALASGDGPWKLEAAQIVGQAQRGLALQSCLDRWADGSDDPTIALLVDAMAIAGRTGGSYTHVVDAVGAIARQQVELRMEVRALASQARASAVVLVITPFAFAMAMAVADGRVRSFYLNTAVGPLCVLVGLGLDGVGAWWMSRLVRGVR